MKTLGFLVLAALAGATATPTLAEQPPRGARGCEFPAFQWNQNGVDLYQQQQLLLPGPAGRVVFRTSRSYQCRAQDPRTRRTIPGSAFYYRQGLHTVTGQELVPHLYDKVVPYSETAAFVLREDGKWARYRFGAGEEQIPVGAVDFNILWPVIGNVGEFDNGDPCGRPRGERPRRTIAAFSTGEPDAGGHVEVVVYSGDEPPVVLTGLGGPGVEYPIDRLDDVLITHWADEAGVRHSRLYSLTGAPLSPILGRVEKWSTEGTPVVCEAFADLGLFVAGRSLDSDPDQPLLGRLLLPIDSGGRPLALPEGAIGVFPVPLRFYDNERTPPAGWGRTQAWSVVYPTSDDGFLFTLTPGSLAFALDQAPTATRHEGFARDTFRGQDPRTGYERDEAYISVQSTQDQLWRGYQYGHWQVASAAANDEVMAARNAGQAVRDIRDAERQARDAAERARSRTRYTDALANGTGCNLPPPIGFADDDIIFAHAAACPQTYSLDQRGWVQWRGAPAETVSGIDHAHVQAQQAAIAEQAELAEQASRYISPGEREAMWRAAGDAWVQGINQGADARQDARRRQYEADWQRSQRAY